MKRLPASGGRVAINLGQSLVRMEPLFAGAFGLTIEPLVNGLDLPAWIVVNRELVLTYLLGHGALLFRNFKLDGLPAFEAVVRAASGGELLEYMFRSTPRTTVARRIYTATEYPSHLSIPLHNENSYQRTWPSKLFFYCAAPAKEGGATPLADGRNVLLRIDKNILERFVEKKVMYVRNYGRLMDIPWQEVFQTQDKFEVEAFCRRAEIDFEWKEGDQLTTRQICQATIMHPDRGEMVWFNQAHLFSPWALEESVRNSLLSSLKQEDLPRNSFYGDGSPIEPSVIARINQLYNEESFRFNWRKGDILILDNRRIAHGRDPYSGERQILVAMTG